MPLGGSGARRYAEALLDIATEERAVPQYRRSLDELVSVFRPDVLRALRDPRVPLERRRGAIDAATKDEPRAIRAVLDILVERDRIALVPDIARAFGDLVDRREGIVHAKISTSLELDERERADVLRQLERASGKTIKATFTVDPRLIGGARVQIGDRLVDASLRAKLESLSRELASS